MSKQRDHETRGSKFLEEYEKKKGKEHNLLKSGDPGK
jgi:hypothetical protein